MIVDTSGLLAFFNRRQPMHGAAVAAVEAATDLIVSPYVVAEVDYLVATRLGTQAELAVLESMASGSWTLAEFDTEDLRQARDVVARYGDLDVGVADASQVVLAHRFRTRKILTLDQRHLVR